MGVLLQLHVKNIFCCCLNSSDDRNAYQAVRSIQRSCRYVIQYPTKTVNGAGTASSNGNAGGNFFQGLFGSSGSGSGTAPVRSHQQQQLRTLRRVRMVLQDSDVDGQPIICITPIADEGTNDNEENTDAIMTIKLRRIDKIHLDGDQIVMYAKPKKVGESAGTGTTGSSTAVELLRVAILLQQQDPSIRDDGGDETLPSPATTTTSTTTVRSTDPALVSSDTRNMIVHHWMVLVEWERQRQIKLAAAVALHNIGTDGNSNAMDANMDNNSDTDDDDDEHHRQSNSNGNFITRHAQKVKHYAEREIELQRVKRQREIRKSQLIAQTGGLKYTALAMSQQQQQQA